jgi:hypothetical protein
LEKGVAIELCRIGVPDGLLVHWPFGHAKRFPSPDRSLNKVLNIAMLPAESWELARFVIEKTDSPDQDKQKL